MSKSEFTANQSLAQSANDHQKANDQLMNARKPLVFSDQACDNQMGDKDKPETWGVV